MQNPVPTDVEPPRIYPTNFDKYKRRENENKIFKKPSQKVHTYYERLENATPWVVRQ